jgi:chemotaxis protein MotB
MQQGGVRADQVTQVRGYADQFLRVKSNPYDPSNRRISILVKNGGDGAAPVVKNARTVDGGTAPAVPGAKGGEAKEQAGEKKTEAQEGKASAVTPAKPAAGTPAAAPVSKPGLMGRLMGMLPGKKK